jgi:RNA polymerase sigma-70 factor (ECF subfamily)
MADEASFRDLIERVRSGDGAAAAELVRRYESAVRRAVRLRLRDRRLRRLLDSMDICQSVMASFFVRAALGRFELSTPEQLLGLLATMARNKLANQVHRARACRRDHRRVEEGAALERDVVAHGASPSRQVIARELLDEARRRLSPEERRLLELRNEGCAWEEIARDVGGSAEARRKQLARAVERVAQDLGLDEHPAE